MLGSVVIRDRVRDILDRGYSGCSFFSSALSEHSLTYHCEFIDEDYSKRRERKGHFDWSLPTVCYGFMEYKPYYTALRS